MSSPAPGTIEARMAQAMAHQAAGRLAEAAELYEGIVAEDPRQVNARHNLGMVRLHLGEFAGAVTALEIAWAQDGGNPGWLQSLPMIGLTLFDRLHWEEALILLATLAALLPCRRLFYRRAQLLGDLFSPGWIAAVAAAVGGSVWLGMFAYRHVDGEVAIRLAVSFPKACLIDGHYAHTFNRRCAVAFVDITFNLTTPGRVKVETAHGFTCLQGNHCQPVVV